MTKWKAALLMAVCAVLCMAALPQGPQRVTVSWDYPPALLDSSLTFRVYHSTLLTKQFSEWEVLTNVPSPNTAVSLVINPGQHYFYVTSSNFWGESDVSDITATPTLPQSVKPKIARGG